MKKPKVPKIVIDDGLAIMQQLSQHGLLTTNHPKPIPQKEVAGKVTTGGDDGDSNQPGQFTGL